LQCAVGQSGAAAAVAAAAVAIITQLCSKSVGWVGFVLHLKHVATEWQANNHRHKHTQVVVPHKIRARGEGGGDGASTYLSAGSKHLVG
jgi:hypothetical protein